MTAADLIADLAARGVILAVADRGTLQVDAPRGAVTRDLRKELIRRKDDLLGVRQTKADACVDPDNVAEALAIRREERLPAFDHLNRPELKFPPAEKADQEQSGPPRERWTLAVERACRTRCKRCGGRIRWAGPATVLFGDPRPSDQRPLASDPDGMPHACGVFRVRGDEDRVGR